MVAVTLPWGIERDRYLGGSRAMQLEGQAGHAIHERAVLKKLKARTNGRGGRTLRQGQAGSSAKKERAGRGEGEPGPAPKDEGAPVARDDGLRWGNGRALEIGAWSFLGHWGLAICHSQPPVLRDAIRL